MEAPKKLYYEPMHTAEHILNQTMVRMFGCGRSRNAHIERKKSKCDYLLPEAPTENQITAIEKQVNAVIDSHLPVSISVIPKEEASCFLDLSKLPSDAGDTVRVVRVGDYDACACIGMHVENTSEIGRFVILSHDYQDNIWRVRFKLE
ncbi:hypothetical protein [Microbacter margulisiae]|uniref:Ser-tRNA(Ala) deacylase AlaX n=1 Tax=Microbacter margulisiae TaxID=1350067 RepID=A0A7W5DRP3_9PORP|nr:hypothetical protein [Microbacter margulisiae]MBB3187696.1 Ser-tRNA(Ala) deacylase AlaX [Microbacter margulisiae]